LKDGDRGERADVVCDDNCPVGGVLSLCGVAVVSFIPNAPKPSRGADPGALDDPEFEGDREEPNPNRLDGEEPDPTRVPLEVDDKGGIDGGDVADGLEAESEARLCKTVCTWAGILTDPPACCGAALKLVVVQVGVGGCTPPVFGGVGGFITDCDDDGRGCFAGKEGGGGSDEKREENPRESGSGEEGGEMRSGEEGKVINNQRRLSVRKLTLCRPRSRGQHCLSFRPLVFFPFEYRHVEVYVFVCIDP